MRFIATDVLHKDLSDEIIWPWLRRSWDFLGVWYLCFGATRTIPEIPTKANQQNQRKPIYFYITI